MSYRTIPVTTSFWGHQFPNRTWAGMIGLLLEGKADLGLSSMADIPFRREVVDFNIPTNEVRLSAFFQNPSAISTEFSALLKPFHTSLWISVVLLLLGMSAAAMMTSMLSSILSNRREHLNGWSISDSILWSLSAISCQGWYKWPQETAMRILVITGSFAGILIFSVYSGIIIAFLSVVGEPIQNLGQLLELQRFTHSIGDSAVVLKILAVIWPTFVTISR